MVALRQIAMRKQSQMMLLMVCASILLITTSYRQSTTYRTHKADERPGTPVSSSRHHIKHLDIGVPEELIKPAPVPIEDIPHRELNNGDSFNKVSNSGHRLVTATEATIVQTAAVHVVTETSDQPSQYKARFQTVDDIKRFRENLNSWKTNLFAEARQKHIINCSNVNEIVLGKYLGHGLFRSAYRGTFRNMDVIVKIAYKDAGFVKCARDILEVAERGTLDDIKDALYFTRCKDKQGSDATIHEVIHHALLDYPMVVRLLGFCVRDSDPLVRNNTSALDMGIVSVFEYGDISSDRTLKTTSWVDRVRYGRDIAALLELLHNSLLGSLSYDDMKINHLNTVNGDIKIFDLDNYFVPKETVCRKEDLVDPDRAVPHSWQRPSRLIRYVETCNYDIPCTDGLCKRTNEIYNIERCVSRLYAKFFRNGTMPEHIHGHITTFLDGVVQNKTSASDIKDFFNDILLKVNYPHPRYM